jgi:hypothetical protein
LLRSVGHRVKTHKITPATDNERGDIEIQDYVFLPRGEDDRIPPRTLVMDVTMCRIVYVIHTFLARRERERKDNGQNFSRREYHRSSLSLILVNETPVMVNP